MWFPWFAEGQASMSEATENRCPNTYGANDARLSLDVDMHGGRSG